MPEPDQTRVPDDRDAAHTPESGQSATPASGQVDDASDDAAMDAVLQAGGGAPGRRLPSRANIVRAFLRPSRGQFAVGLLCLVLGLGAMLQVRSLQGTQAYSGARREDLVAMIDSLDKEHQRLQQEQNQLEATREDLQTGADKQKVATDEAQRRIDTLSILAGTAPAYGPGIRLTLIDPQGKVTPAMVLDAIEELRDAGAEAIEINDSVRVVASTSFTQGPQGVVVDGRTLTFPLTIDAIGDPATLEGGARFRGGIVSQVQAPTIGGSAVVTQLDEVDVTALAALPTKTYAKPAK